MDPGTHCDLSEKQHNYDYIYGYYNNYTGSYKLLLGCLPSQVLPSPVNPGGQEQVKLPSVLSHIAMESHGLSAHSFISAEKYFSMCDCVCVLQRVLPTHKLPSIVKPVAQIQIKEPGTLLHSELSGQLLRLS